MKTDLGTLLLVGAGLYALARIVENAKLPPLYQRGDLSKAEEDELAARLFEAREQIRDGLRRMKESRR